MTFTIGDFFLWVQTQLTQNGMPLCQTITAAMPNTHRRRDSTVELRSVGVGGVNTIRNQLTTTADGFSRQFGNWPNRLHSGLTTWILIDIDNFFNNDVIMWSLVINITGNCKLGHDCRRVRSHRRHDATGLRCWQICSDSSRLSPTSCEFRTHHRRNSTRQLSGVGGMYWALLQLLQTLSFCPQ